MPNPLHQWFFEIPVVTRLYLTASILLTAAVHIEFTSYFQLYLNYNLVLTKYQLWRCVTTFLYFGNFSFNWVFNMFFIGSYCRMLEEGSFHGKTADFCWMLFLFAISLLAVGPLLNMPFLSSALTFTIVYVWARRHPDVQMSFLGMFTFSAPYLPFVLLAFNALMYSSLPAGNLTAIVLGHTYYFLEDVWPNQPSSGGRRILAAPQFLLRFFETQSTPDDLPRPHQD